MKGKITARSLTATALMLAGCATTEAPAPRTGSGGAPSPPSLQDLQRTYLPRIADHGRSVDSREARREEIVEQMLDDAERSRELHRALVAEIEAKSQRIELLEEQSADRRERLAELRGAAEGGSSDQEIRDLERETAKLTAEIERERRELEERRAKGAEVAAKLAHLEDLDEEALFRDAMQDVYREGIDLHLGFYHGVMELSRQQLAADDAGGLLDHFEDRIRERNQLRGQDVAPQAFATLRHEFELDQRMSQAWLSAFILEVRFSISEYRLESISEDERAELALLAEALAESWERDASLVMLIDGHSDSRKFRGRSDCVSATLNKDLSRQRAEEVRDFFTEELGGEARRIEVDWYGNFSRQAADAGGETENRRIELRISPRRADGSHGSHRDYFTMRSGLELAGRSFVRRPGAWVDAACAETEPAAEVEYLSAGYRQLAGRLGLDASVTAALGADGRKLDVRLGNELVVADGERCVRVAPCVAE